MNFMRSIILKRLLLRDQHKQILVLFILVLSIFSFYSPADAQATTEIDTTKSNPNGQTQFAPLQEFPLELRLRLSNIAPVGNTIVNPSIIDTLPAQLEFVSWDSVTFVNVTGPIPFFRRTGNTLQWYWENAPLAGSLQPAPSGLPNTVPATGSRAFTMTANGTNQDVIVRFTVRIAPTTVDNIAAPTPYTNYGYFIGPTDPICMNGTLGTEAGFGIDDGDGNAEPVCQTNFDFRVSSALALDGYKWVRNPNYATNAPRFPEFAINTDNTVGYDTTNTDGQSCNDASNYFEYPTGSGNFWTRFPCVAFGFPENPLTALPPTGTFTTAAPNDDQFEYLLDVRSAGNVAGQDYYLYDLLPRVGDTGSGGPLSATPRLSTFAAYLTGPIVPLPFSGVTNAGNIIIEYSVAANPCRAEVFPVQGACTNDWTPVFPTANPRAVTAYRIRFAANMQIAVGGRMLFRVPMVIAYDAQYGNTQIAWNSFAHTAVNSQDIGAGFLTAAESRKAGIRVPERFSIGNRVWRDSDNSGTINAADDTTPGIAGVVVNLYADFDGDGVPDGAAIDTDTTDANGFYLFDDIIPNANPNNNRYIVGIPASNFATVGSPLYNLRSSTGAAPTLSYVTPPEANADSDDNGFDPVTLGQEVLSDTINLVLYNERTNETDISGSPSDGAFSRGTRGEANNNSDISIDFGFFGGVDTPFSVGNRVWYDDGSNGAGGFNLAQRNNGLQDANERGVNGVRVELYRDGNGNNTPEPAEFIRFDITAAGGAGPGRPGTDLNGYYLFDNLDAGTYFVVIPASEFGTGDPLGGWHSSSFNGTETVGAPGSTPTTDLDDNGVEPANRRPDLSGVSSGAIVFVRVPVGNPGLEITGETDLSYQPDPGTPFNSATYNGVAGLGPTGWDGPESIGRWDFGLMTDDSSNVAVDFGFIPPMSIGNRVWLDDSNDPAQWQTGGSRNNGFIEATDDGNPLAAGIQNAGIAGVVVQLYLDTNNNFIVDGSDTLITTTDTVTDGYYLFDGLAPGNYLVRIPSTEFGVGEPLNGLISSFDAVAQPNPTNQTDSNDNGVDNANPATNGITSRQIQLTYLAESTTEGDIAPAGDATTLPGPASRGRFGEANEDSDLTIDFGFVRPPMSIGNQVFLDDHPTNQALRNNGIFNGGAGGETGIANVQVVLYIDSNANGAVDAGENSGFIDITDVNGFYLFTNLPPGNYIAAVIEANFGFGGALENMISSRSVAPNPAPADNGADGNDNGIDASVAGVGIISSRINLVYGAEPTTETPVNTATDGVIGSGTHGESNADSDLSVDFGFYVPMSIGNRVWLDDSNNFANWNTTSNNAILDLTTDDLDNPNIPGVQPLGVAGVTLRLYRDANANGIVDGGEDTGQTVTTDVSGYYLFHGLTRGNYIVGVEASNFIAGRPLFGFNSSTNAPLPTDNNADNTDDGSGIPATPDIPDATYGIITPSIQLSYTNQTIGLEPLAGVETDPTPQTQANRGPNGERDDFSNLTIDFGFVRPPTSIGNQIWLDEHPTNPALTNNGIFNGGAGGESVIQNVQVALYQDANTNGVIDAGEDTGVRDLTDANGFYLFSDLPPGAYIVAITELNFGAGGSLENFISSTGSTGDNQTDNNDNGIDTTLAGVGIVSNVITLASNEPLNENPVNTGVDGPNGRGTNGELDNNSDLTIDFGFIPSTQVSLGNLVWLDNGGTTGTARDGIRNGDELPIANVRVNLYRDVDTNGAPDDLGTPGPVDDIVTSDTTDVNGHYLFDALAPGNYLVELAAANFGAGAVLDGYGSSVTSAAPDLNNNDYGIDTPNTIAGIRSGTIVLALNAEPIGDTDPVNTKGYGSNGVDANGNMTVDFGVYRAMSIGNRVWFDTSGDGTINGGENGIAGVTVELRADSNNNGIFEPATDLLITTPGVTATDVTDALGYYLFGNLLPGRYFLYIPPSQFTGVGILTGFNTTVDNVGGITVDSNDNGVSDGGTGIVSNLVTLTENGAPTTETDFSGNAASDGPRFIGLRGENNANSDISIDFGFTATAMSLGNRVWLDNNNNGQIDAGDDYNTATAGDQPGVPGVLVNLYADSDANNVPDGAVIRSDTTDTNGYYLFDNLAPGRYLVQIAPSNFQPAGILRGLFSSLVTNIDQTTDSNDNGIDNVSPATNGIFSSTITMTVTTMPTGETDLSANLADGPDSRGNNGEADNNSNLTIDFGFARGFDWGDAPDSYSTTGAAGGARHLTFSTIFIGSIEDNEGDGQPNPAADGDDTNNSGGLGDDEDGVTIPTAVAGTNLIVEVRAFNNTGTPATLIGWVDFNGNGTFDAAEAMTATVPTSPTTQTITLTFLIPATADVDTGGQTYARFRLTTDASINTGTPAGLAANGEVEDYLVAINPPGISITKTDGLNSIVVGQTTTYTIVIQYSGLTGITRIVNDTTNPAGAFVPASISWTCDANAQASCVTGLPLGTDIATDTDIATPPVAGLITAQSVDLEQNGQLVYRLTGTLRPDYDTAFPGIPNVVNTVTLDSGETASDTDGIIFDPPTGIKTGTALNSTTIRWTMVWFNTGGTQAASMTDVLDLSQINPINLVCTPFGTTTTNLCEVRGGNTVFWDGTMGDGTTPADRTNNRLEISFEVTVAGPGSYNNTATFTTAGGAATPAAGSVVINPDGSTGTTNGSGAGIVPTISKTVNPIFSFSGGTVTWTILVTNPHNQSIANVTVSDNVPPELEILSTNSTNGTVTVNGQAINVTIPTLNALETVSVAVTTRVRANTAAQELMNYADLFTPGNANQRASATLNIVAELPHTGETPTQWELIRVLLLTFTLGVVSLLIYRQRISRHHQ